MKLFVGSTHLNTVFNDFDVNEHGYITSISFFRNEMDETGKHIEETYTGIFKVGYADFKKNEISFIGLDPKDDYVPTGFVITISDEVINHFCGIVIGTSIENHQLYPTYAKINPEILEKYKHLENGKRLYLKYHDEEIDKNVIATVTGVFNDTHLIVEFIDDHGYKRKHIYQNMIDLDVEPIVW